MPGRISVDILENRLLSKGADSRGGGLLLLDKDNIDRGLVFLSKND